MKLTMLDQKVLEAVSRIRSRRIATIDHIRRVLIGVGTTPEPTLQQIFRSLENLETAEYVESCIVKAGAGGDIRLFAETEKAREEFKLGG